MSPSNIVRAVAPVAKDFAIGAAQGALGVALSVTAILVIGAMEHHWIQRRIRQRAQAKADMIVAFQAMHPRDQKDILAAINPTQAPTPA